MKHMLTVAISLALVSAPSLSASQQTSPHATPRDGQSSQNRGSPHNGSVQQEWSGEEISSLSSEGGAGLERFNQQFSNLFLDGYTSGGEFDASMETYFVDEDNQVVALYQDTANPNDVLLQAQYSNLELAGATDWERQISSQVQAYDPWVSMTVAQTARDLEKNLNLAAQQGKPYLVWVNVPSFTLRVYDTRTKQEMMRSRVIVGASGTQTPIFSTNVTNLKFNPDWSPPPSLQRKGKVYTPPSDNSPLGQVRFSTDNNMNIYLHDTNNPELYERQIRALSAGCIRVEQWHELAQILGGMNAEEVDRATEGNRINFKDVPDSRVWISYQRIDMNEGGEMVLFGDIYRKQNLPANNLPRSIENAH